MLLRLIKDGKVVGMEEHNKTTEGFIWIQHLYLEGEGWDKLAWSQEHEVGSPIEHDRKDLYTGIDIDGEKVFENDLLKDTVKKVGKVVALKAGAFKVYNDFGEWDGEVFIPAEFPDYLTMYIFEALQAGGQVKITGIQGVDNES
jgi:hypothetical protein